MGLAAGGMVAGPRSGGVGLVPSAACWWGGLRLASVSPSAAIADDFADATGGFGAYHGARPGAPRRRATRTSLSPKANARMLDPDCGHVAAMAEVADGPSRRRRRSSRPHCRETPSH